MPALEPIPRRASWRRRPACCPPALRPWLVDEGSLSAKIAGRARFDVSVLNQGPAPVRPDERRFFGRGARVREVLLCADGVPVVFARSVLAAGSRSWRAWHRLGSRPLASLLFGKAGVRRSALSFSRLRGAGACGGPQWARRRLFLCEGRLLLLTEVFLPAILEIGYGMDRSA